MAIPLVDLKAQYQTIEQDVLASVQEVLRGMQLFLGENVTTLEDIFSSFCGVRHGIGVGSGTEALHLALRALDIGQGDEVITVSHTFIATAEAILMAGARPVFVDIEPNSMNMDPALVEKAITPRTKAIVPVHIYGHPADMSPILDVAKRHGLFVIEDASQAHGAQYNGQPVGSLGNVACFSFYYSKNLGAYGEAGMLTTDDEEIAKKVNILRDHGSIEKYTHVSFGINGRIDEIQAAILNVKLPHLKEWNEKRRELANLYSQKLSSLPLTLPTEQEWAQHVYHLYVVRTPHRDALLKWLHSQGIMAGIHYPIPVHLQGPYKDYGPKSGGLTVTEKTAQEILSLPLYPELSIDQLNEVVQSVEDFFAEVAPK